MAKRRHRYQVRYLRSDSNTEHIILCKSPRKIKKALKSLELGKKIDAYQWVKVVDTKKCKSNEEKQES